MSDNQTFIDPLFVSNYLFLSSECSQNAKRIKRKFNKHKISRFFNNYKYVHFDTDSVKLLYDFLVRNNTNDNSHVGFLSDSCVVMNNINNIPPPPLEWDILCLQSDISKYDYNNKDNNIYWCCTKINNSHNFVVNGKFIKTLIGLLKETKSWSDVMNAFNKEAVVFSVTQHTFTEESQMYVHVPFDKLYAKNVCETEKEKILNDVAKSCGDILVRIKSQENLTKLYTGHLNNDILPKVSCVCVVTDVNKFFHSLLTFLKLDYPRDKLEFVIVDDIDIEKRVKSFMPNDSRIKVVNLSGKNNPLPFGYKLNMGIKYASGDVVCHLFDTHVYSPSKFSKIIKTFLLSKHDMITSYDSGLYNKKKNVSLTSDVLDIANAIYCKNFWKVRSFNEKQNDHIVLWYHFLKSRMACVGFLPFVDMSFEVTDNNELIGTELPFDVRSLVDTRLAESFTISF